METWKKFSPPTDGRMLLIWWNQTDDDLAEFEPRLTPAFWAKTTGRWEFNEYEAYFPGEIVIYCWCNAPEFPKAGNNAVFPE